MFVLVYCEENKSRVLFNHYERDKGICFGWVLIEKVESTVNNGETEANLFNYILYSFPINEFDLLLYINKNRI